MLRNTNSNIVRFIKLRKKLQQTTKWIQLTTEKSQNAERTKKVH